MMNKLIPIIGIPLTLSIILMLIGYSLLPESTTVIRDVVDIEPNIEPNSDPAELQKVLDSCACFESGGDCYLEGHQYWNNNTHKISSIDCKWQTIEDAVMTEGKEIFCAENYINNGTHCVDKSKYTYPFVEYIGHDTEKHLKGVLGNCACQERISNNPNGKEKCPEPALNYSNTTHAIDNHTCEWNIK